MTIHTYSSRDFTRDVGTAKRAAAKGPVFITDRGRPAFALLKIEDYYQLTGRQEASLLHVMDAIAGGPDIAFDAPSLQVKLPAADLG